MGANAQGRERPHSLFEGDLPVKLCILPYVLLRGSTELLERFDGSTTQARGVLDTYQNLLVF